MKLTATDPVILHDSDYSNKLNDNIQNDLTCTQSNKDLIEALKSKILTELMLHIRIFVKEEPKFSKQENDLDNSNTKIIKSLEKEHEFLKQELVKKTKLIEWYISKIFGNSKDNRYGNDLSRY